MSMFIYKIQNAKILWYNGTRLCNYKAIVNIYGIYISCEIGRKSMNKNELHLLAYQLYVYELWYQLLNYCYTNTKVA